MAMGKCRECGKEASSEAKACPHCGTTKPVKKSVGRFGTIIVVLLGVAFFGSIISQQQEEAAKPPPTAAELAASAKKEAAFQQTVLIARAVKGSLRDPDSVKWESIRANVDATVVCLEYRAKNGFGGMNLEHAAVIKGKMHQTPEAWNKHCTQALPDLIHVRQAL